MGYPTHTVTEPVQQPGRFHQAAGKEMWQLSVLALYYSALPSCAVLQLTDCTAALLL